MLMTAPTLSYCGVADWRPGRLAALVNDWDVNTVRAAAEELCRYLFIVTDDASEEVLIRSFVKHDGVMRNQKMATAMATAAAGVASKVIRGVIVFTLKKMHAAEPEMSGFNSKTAAAMLTREAIDPASIVVDMPVANTDRNTNRMPVPNTDQNGSVTPITTLSGSQSTYGSGSPAPTPAPTPTTSNEVVEKTGAARKRTTTPATRITEDWQPTKDAVDKLRDDCPDVNLERETANFVDYWLGKPGKAGEKQDWLATWRKWMRTAQSDIEARTARTSPTMRKVAAYGTPTHPNGTPLTSGEIKFAQVEARKDFPNPQVLAAAGIPLTDKQRANLGMIPKAENVVIDIDPTSNDLLFAPPARAIS